MEGGKNTDCVLDAFNRFFAEACVRKICLPDQDGAYLQHDTDLGPLLQVLTPNSLKLDTASERPPTGLFTIPSHAKDLMSEIEKKYQFWYELWNTDYIPLIARRQKLFLK